ncbi:type IV pilin-like G/H family protein [Sphaerothrix gracilis]|uniref:type IV pilin-like G/H family protein n=1 Tax=Sphaerothrix gracilis TaxID=3151835 RepID=UPI0031FBB6A9
MAIGQFLRVNRKYCLLPGVLAGALLAGCGGADEAVSDGAVEQALAAEGQTILSTLNRAQTAYYLETGEFATDIETLDANLPTATDQYRYEIMLTDPGKAVAIAVAQQPELVSYTAAVYVVSADGDTLDGICKTATASTVPPAVPTLEASQIRCPKTAQPIQSD